MYICVGLTVRKSTCIHCFDSFVNAEVIVALQCGLTACVQFSAPRPQIQRNSTLTNLAHGASTGRSSAWAYLVTQSWSPFTPWESVALSQGAKLFHASFCFALCSKNGWSWIDGYSLDIKVSVEKVLIENSIHNAKNQNYSIKRNWNLWFKFSYLGQIVPLWKSSLVFIKSCMSYLKFKYLLRPLSTIRPPLQAVVMHYK